jgi:23S rRNA (guanosine2251-2'-O)-methyltransferase
MRKVPGIHACLEVIRVRPRQIKKVWLRHNYIENKDLAAIFDEASKYTKNIEKVGGASLSKMYENNQGVVIEVDETPELNWKTLEKNQTSRLLLLDGLEDPHNLGAIIRTAWLLKMDGIITLKNRSVGLTPAVCKVAAGGVEHVPMEFVSQLVDPIKDLKELGFWIYGLSEKAEKLTYSEEMPDKVALVLGAEESGLKKSTLDACDILLKIPQINQHASYNVSVAAAMMMSELVRQKGL